MSSKEKLNLISDIQREPKAFQNKQSPSSTEIRVTLKSNSSIKNPPSNIITREPSIDKFLNRSPHKQSPFEKFTFK